MGFAALSVSLAGTATDWAPLAWRDEPGTDCRDVAGLTLRGLEVAGATTACSLEGSNCDVGWSSLSMYGLDLTLREAVERDLAGAGAGFKPDARGASSRWPWGISLALPLPLPGAFEAGTGGGGTDG